MKEIKPNVKSSLESKLDTVKKGTEIIVAGGTIIGGIVMLLRTLLSGKK